MFVEKLKKLKILHSKVNLKYTKLYVGNSNRFKDTILKWNVFSMKVYKEEGYSCRLSEKRF